MAVSGTTAESASLGPPPATTGFLGWMRRNLFSSIWNALLTIFCAYLLIRIVPPLVNWLFIDATWSDATPQQCRAAEGACWAFVREKHRVILFGRYPFEEQWRPLAATLLMLALLVASCTRPLWSRCASRHGCSPAPRGEALTLPICVLKGDPAFSSRTALSPLFLNGRKCAYYAK